MKQSVDTERWGTKAHVAQPIPAKPDFAETSLMPSPA